MIYLVTNLFTAQGYQPTIHRCAPQPGRPPRMWPSLGPPCRCAREAGAHGARARARGRVRECDICTRTCPTPRPPRRACLSAMQLALAIGTCESAASPVLLTACTLLPRCRQPQVRAVGLDGHRALDISVTIGRRDVDTTVTTIRPSSRPRALPLGQAARSLCLRSLCAGRGRPRGCAPSAHWFTRLPSRAAPSTPA